MHPRETYLHGSDPVHVTARVRATQQPRPGHMLYHQMCNVSDVLTHSPVTICPTIESASLTPLRPHLLWVHRGTHLA